MNSNSSDFPPDFKWAVATAAHQIEGQNVDSNWWEFENTPGKIRDGRPSGIATDHWNRLEEDTALLAALNVDQYRFSIEWAKIEPRPGEWKEDAIQHYRRELELLAQHEIEPLITLQHFTLPKWVSDRGGFEWEGLPDAFAAFSARAFRELGTGVRDWITINEPQSILAAGYIEGVHPPEKRDLANIHRPARIMVLAHARAYHELHAIARARKQDIRVGMAHHLRIFEAASVWNPLDLWAAGLLSEVGNWSLVDALETGKLKIRIPLTVNYQETLPEARNTQDFIGVNYYSRDLIRFNPRAPGCLQRLLKKGAEVSDLNWEIYPEGLYRLLKMLESRYPGKPLLITENGLADHRDSLRSRFIVEHLRWVKKAIDEGVRVENYCHWSFLDNYEWQEGYEPRFGLYAVNYETQERTLRPSGKLYSEIARTSRLPEKLSLILIAILALTGSAAASADELIVSPLPYTTRTRPYSAYSGSVRGDPRTVGMAGATVGLADTYTAAIDNPAGLAMTLALGDTHASTNRIYDGHLQSEAAAIQASGIGAAVTINNFGISLGANNIWDEGQYYRISGVSSPQWIEAYVREFRLGTAYRPHPRLSIGTQLRLARLTQGIGPENSISSNPTASDSSWGLGLGALYRFPSERLLLGMSWSSGMTLDASGDLPFSFSVLPGFAQPVLIPSKLSVGVGYIPNRILRADFSLQRISATPGAALLSDQNRFVGSSATIQPHFGVAYTFADFTPIRGLVFAGTYLQPSRIEERPSRLHLTLGAEAKWSFMNFGVGIDTAVSYSNYLASIGVDPFRVMELMDVIPRSKPQRPKGFLPNPWYQSDDGLTSALQNEKPRQALPGIDPLDVGKKIPGKIEERVRNFTPGQVIDTLRGLPKSIQNDIEDVRDTLNQQD